jgi:hypothetical protein
MNPVSKITDLDFLHTPYNYPIYGLTCLGIGIWLLFTAVSGFLDVSMRGYVFFSLQVKSTPFRIVCFVLSVGFLTAAIWMFRHSLPPLRNP